MSKQGHEYLASSSKRQFDRLICEIALRPIAHAAMMAPRPTGVDPIFTQKRSGADGALFDIFKLTTLVDEKLAFRGAGMLRTLGLDESLQYRNIISGDMIFSGTRRAMLPSDEARIIELGDQRIVDEWLDEVYPLPPCIVSTDSLFGHTHPDAPHDTHESSNRKLRRDLYDVRHASLKRDLSMSFGKYGLALIKHELHDPSNYTFDGPATQIQ